MSLALLDLALYAACATPLFLAAGLFLYSRACDAGWPRDPVTRTLQRQLAALSEPTEQELRAVLERSFECYGHHGTYRVLEKVAAQDGPLRNHAREMLRLSADYLSWHVRSVRRSANRAV